MCLCALLCVYIGSYSDYHLPDVHCESSILSILVFVGLDSNAALPVWLICFLIRKLQINQLQLKIQ